MRHHVFSVLFVYLCAAGPAWGQISAGMLDDFSGGTTSGWREGAPSPNPPFVETGFGPGGDGDMFLFNESGGSFEPGGRLAMFNDTRWVGDYLSAGIEELSVDLSNLGNTPISMRFLFEGEGGDVFSSAVQIAPESGWQSHTFSLDTVDLIAAGDLAATMGNVQRTWFFHSVQAQHPPLPTLAAFGMDNLLAVGPPASLAGDYNNNGQVEQADLDLVLLNWGADGTTPPANWTNDLPEGTIDQAELDGVLLNWGSSAGQAAGAVPEPGTCCLLLCALATLLFLRPARAPSAAT